MFLVCFLFSKEIILSHHVEISHTFLLLLGGEDSAKLEI